MNITQERYSLLRLWLESFKVVNHCAVKLLWIILISAVLFAVAIGLFVLVAGGSTALAMVMGGKQAFAPQTIGFGALLAYFAFVLCTNVYATLFFTVFNRLVASQASATPQPLAEVFSSSVIPTLYQIVAGILIGLAMFVVGIVFALSARISPVLVPILALVLFFAVGVRLFYSFIAIAVANKGPIEGIVHSWKMTSGKNYWDILLMVLIMAGSAILMYLLLAAIFYGLFITIPLHFSDSFSLAHPSLIWILVALVLGILAMFCYFVIMAFPVLVFVNRNAMLFDARDTQGNSTFIPLPALELPNIQPNPNHMQQSQTTVRTPVVTEEDLNQAQEDLSAKQVVEEPEPAAPAPTAEKASEPQKMPSLEGLEVSKTSVNTSEKETDSLSQHLDKVYTPQKEDLSQHKEEDRMPTILFDDEMAQQLQKNQAIFAPESNKDNPDKGDDEPDSIKMSKF